MTNREEAQALLAAIEENIDGEYATGALVGIGYGLLDIADAIREQTTALREAMLNEGVRTVEL